MSVVDHDATLAFLRREAATAARDDDGHRAWVVRDALEKLPPEEAAELRTPPWASGSARERLDLPRLGHRRRLRRARGDRSARARPSWIAAMTRR